MLKYWQNPITSFWKHFSINNFSFPNRFHHIQNCESEVIQSATVKIVQRVPQTSITNFFSTSRLGEDLICSQEIRIPSWEWLFCIKNCNAAIVFGQNLPHGRKAERKTTPDYHPTKRPERHQKRISLFREYPNKFNFFPLRSMY